MHSYSCVLYKDFVACLASVCHACDYCCSYVSSRQLRQGRECIVTYHALEWLFSFVSYVFSKHLHPRNSCFCCTLCNGMASPAIITIPDPDPPSDRMAYFKKYSGYTALVKICFRIYSSQTS